MQHLAQLHLELNPPVGSLEVNKWRYQRPEWEQVFSQPDPHLHLQDHNAWHRTIEGIRTKFSAADMLDAVERVAARAHADDYLSHQFDLWKWRVAMLVPKHGWQGLFRVHVYGALQALPGGEGTIWFLQLIHAEYVKATSDLVRRRLLAAACSKHVREWILGRKPFHGGGSELAPHAERLLAWLEFRLDDVWRHDEGEDREPDNAATLLDLAYRVPYAVSIWRNFILDVWKVAGDLIHAGDQSIPSWVLGERYRYGRDGRMNQLQVASGNLLKMSVLGCCSLEDIDAWKPVFRQLPWRVEWELDGSQFILFQKQVSYPIYTLLMPSVRKFLWQGYIHGAPGWFRLVARNEFVLHQLDAKDQLSESAWRIEPTKRDDRDLEERWPFVPRKLRAQVDAVADCDGRAILTKVLGWRSRTRIQLQSEVLSIRCLLEEGSCNERRQRRMQRRLRAMEARLAEQGCADSAPKIERRLARAVFHTELSRLLKQQLAEMHAQLPRWAAAALPGRAYDESEMKDRDRVLAALLEAFSFDHDAEEIQRRQLAILAKRLGPAPWDNRDTVEGQLFVAEMRSQGLNPNPWLDGIGVRSHTLRSGLEIHIAVELDPLEVVKLGVYFHTYLGTLRNGLEVANRIDQRVVYARTGEGKAVARALLTLRGIRMEAGGLYLNLENEADEADCGQAFVDFFLEIETQVGLESNADSWGYGWTAKMWRPLFLTGTSDWYSKLDTLEPSQFEEHLGELLPWENWPDHALKQLAQHGSWPLRELIAKRPMNPDLALYLLSRWARDAQHFHHSPLRSDLLGRTPWSSVDGNLPGSDELESTLGVVRDVMSRLWKKIPRGRKQLQELLKDRNYYLHLATVWLPPLERWEMIRVMLRCNVRAGSLPPLVRREETLQTLLRLADCFDELGQGAAAAKVRARYARLRSAAQS
jgi:hypothetical protein